MAKKKIPLKKRSRQSARIHKGLSMPVGPGGDSVIGFRDMKDLKEKYFSFAGRLHRHPFIFRMIMLIFVQVISFLILYSRFVEAILIQKTEYAILFVVIFIAICIPLVWSQFSLGVRRCHDMNKAGWLFAVTYVFYIASYVCPILGLDTASSAVQSITAVLFLSLFTVKGTDGDNAYGPSRIR